MTTPTSNPVPSGSPLDLLFNAEKIDQTVNTAGDTYVDRFGVQRLTIAGAINTIKSVNVRGTWVTATAYATKDLVLNSGTWYICVVAHTSSAAFATDLASKWRVYQGVLTSDLSDTATTTKASGMVAWSYLLTYPEGSIGAQAGLIVRPEWFGAKGDSNGTAGNGTDDTAAINAALAFAATTSSLAKSAGSTVQLMPRRAYRVAGTLLITSFTTLDLNNSTLVGTGSTSTGNTVIKTAIYTTGSLVANDANYAGSARLTACRIKNGTIQYAGLGALLTQFGEGCEFKSIQLYNCYNGLDTDFSFYDGIEQVMCRGSSTSWAYRLRNNPNVQTLKHVFSYGMATAFLVDSKAYALTFLSCSAENCTDGIVNANEAYGLSILGCYFELVSRYAIDLNTVYRKSGVKVDGCFFDSCARVVRGKAVNGWEWGASNHRNANCSPGTIDVQTDTTVASPDLACSTGVWRSRAFELINVGNALPVLPGYMLLNTPTDVDAVRTLVSSTAGVADSALAKAKLNAGIIAFDYSGKGGAIPFDVPFCTISRAGAAPNITVIVDTQVLSDGYNFLVFRFDVADNVGTYKIIGRVVGTDVFFDSNAGAKTLTVSDNGSGKVRLTLGNFSHPTVASVSCTGVVRHV